MRRLAALGLAVASVAVVGAPAGAAPSFDPADGRYRGEYTGGDHGPGKVRLSVEALRPGLHGVRLLKWSGTLSCPSGETEDVHVKLTAARSGRSFSGYTVSSPLSRTAFTGRFTDKDALTATVRVTRNKGAERCDTGRVSFAAERVGP